MDLKSKIILISGPTASGKSSFAIKFAKKVNGEIINADSMQVYKQLKILSARPDPKKDENNLDEIIESLKIAVRPLTKEDIKNRKLPNQTTGLVITNIANNSPLVNSIEINSIIIEAQKKKIRSADDLRDITQKAINSNQKTILIAIYNNQNQRRYIGVKLD